MPPRLLAPCLPLELVLGRVGVVRLRAEYANMRAGVQYCAPREYNGEEDSDYSGRRVSTAEYVALSGAGWEYKNAVFSF